MRTYTHGLEVRARANVHGYGGPLEVCVCGCVYTDWKFAWVCAYKHAGPRSRSRVRVGVGVGVRRG